MEDRKTPGQLAYEADCKARPTYDGGAPRATWAALGEVERWSWERNPTPRWVEVDRETVNGHTVRLSRSIRVF